MTACVVKSQGLPCLRPTFTAMVVKSNYRESLEYYAFYAKIIILFANISDVENGFSKFIGFNL